MIIMCFVWACQQPVAPPAPFGPVPTAQQLEWQQMEYYAFVHFNMNTFTDMEWGLGDEPPESFNPTELDVRQWAKVAKDAGMKGIILTAKHHDGFALWPSRYTEHSVKNSPWKNGEGDVIAELASACKAFGLKMGLYLSPWDRNHPDYGKPAYITYYRNQMQELLTQYGPVFEFWVDGANGGDGYYGGANETRNVDRNTYYDWDSTFALAKSLQPDVVIFSDGGPDIRWVGNEKGFAGETNWSTLNRAEFAPGIGPYQRLPTGDEDGTHWVPAECDVSIRPGWYYHESQDDEVKSLEALLDIYYKSVGSNGNLLLNLPVDRRGLVHENDIAALMQLKEALDNTFANDLSKHAAVSTTSERGAAYRTSNLLDDDFDSYWAAAEGEVSQTITLDFDKKVKLNRLMLQEYIPLGQRVRAFELWAQVGGADQKIAEGTTIGYKRILRFPEVSTNQVRVKIMDAKAAPVLSKVGVFLASSEPE